MAEVGTLDVLNEIHALVSDKLQVVSYKWLSRNFSVSSNDAKRILQEFVEQHGSGLEVIYTLSGWLKNSTSTYQIKLVSGLKLAEAKKEFENNCSIQVYSVQTCIPKDIALLWNAEFVQAEQLFDQPATIDNCLRDNRFCGVSNSFVKRNADGTSVGGISPRPKTAEVKLSSKSTTALQTPTVPQQKQGNIQKVSPKVGQSPAVVEPVVKSESNSLDFNAQVNKPHAGKEKETAFPANKKTVQNEKSSSGTGGSLANLWGRASEKSIPICPPGETNNVVLNPIVTAEAQICAREAIDTVSSDDDEQDINHKRASNGEGGRKRRVVFDFSDEEDDYENAVNLSSPDPPKSHSIHYSEHNSKGLVFEKNNASFEEQKGDQLKIKQEKSNEKPSTLLPKGNKVVASKSKTTGISLPEKTQSPTPEDGVNQKDKAINSTTNSPKRRKVLKTRIDERGREVTEVVWEGEEINTDKNNTISDTSDNRPPGAKKLPSLAPNAPSNAVGKAGNKKTGKGTGVKDAKQGNILSFFKRV